MTELIAKSACAELLPVTAGSLTLSEVDLGQMTSIAPYGGRAKAVSAALKKSVGLDFPAPNRSKVKADVRLIWFGREMALLTGAEAPAALVGDAALTDQSDAWACVELSGEGVEDVLARLVPVDLRAAHFKRGHTVRTQVQHLNASITRTGANTMLILTFRSMAQSLVHEIEVAMEAWAARG